MTLADSPQPVGNAGGRSRTRTYDPLIKSQLLYHLSYAPLERYRPIALQRFLLAMILSESRFPIFRIMLENAASALARRT